MTPTKDDVMDADIVKRMREEEADLSRKLQAVRNFLSAYGEKPVYTTIPPAAAASPGASGSREKVELEGFGRASRIAVLLSMTALRASNTLMKTRELVDFIESRGHEVSGANKINALGALLSRSVDIISHGKSGWELADRDKARDLIEKNSDLIGGLKENGPDDDFDVLMTGPDAGKDDGPTSPFHGIKL